MVSGIGDDNFQVIVQYEKDIVLKVFENSGHYQVITQEFETYTEINGIRNIYKFLLYLLCWALVDRL